MAGALRFSATELIREGTLRYLDQLEHPRIVSEPRDGDVGTRLR